MSENVFLQIKDLIPIYLTHSRSARDAKKELKMLFKKLNLIIQHEILNENFSNGNMARMKYCGAVI